MHMWSCTSPAERRWAVHKGIHTKERNQLAFEKVVQLVEITTNVRFMEYRRVGCGIVLPWQRDEGMLDCQSGLEVDPVRTGTCRGMTGEEIARQVALITRDPIRASAPPSADVVFGRRACIFCPYPREDDSDEEPVPEAADDPALRMPREIDKTHDDPDSEEARAHTARRAADRADEEMLGGGEEFWGPLGEVASTGGTEARVTTPTPTSPAAEVMITFPGDIAGGGGTIGSSSGGGDGTTGGGRRDDRSRGGRDSSSSSAGGVGSISVGGGGTGGKRSSSSGWAGGSSRRSSWRSDNNGVEEAVAVEEEEAPSAAAVEGGAVDEAVQAGQRRDEGAVDARLVVQETAMGLIVPLSGLHLAQGRQSHAVQMAVHGVPPPVITDLGSEPVVVAPRLPSHFAPQEVRRPLDAEELAREAVRDVTRLDRRIFDQRLEHPAWQAIPSVPWAHASPVWSGSTSTGGRVAGHVQGVSGGVTETAPGTRDMPPPPPRPPVGDPSLSPTGRGSRSPHTPRRCRIRDMTAVPRDVCDSDTTTTVAREVPASGCEPQRGRGRGVSSESLEYALRAATRAVQEQTPRKRGVPPHPRPVPAAGGAALGESSGAEGLGMPRGSRSEQTVAEASARVVVLRKGGDSVTIEEEDPDTDAAVREQDEDYEGKEEGEEESKSGSDGDDDDDYDEPPPPPGPPPTCASTRSAARTSSSARGRKRSTSGSQGGTRRQSGKGKKGR
ncbi:hypothetical protein CBR_g51391 [Chara braunii]|uniref:Uncharacterized protein n=1 Tax=Chara braunii TaxID=69332 RepID=A0A388M8H4_CHABU|nr:hypothetical protein CBR_g51391 [Chara braunii]|eukprot:GBG90884.1 hypothetical protein CBR_g51391 [Chara braunii]